jgi:hypothetical protein
LQFYSSIGYSSRYSYDERAVCQLAQIAPYQPIMAKHGLSAEEVEDLKEAFNMFDVDGGGKWLTACPWIR